MFDDLDDYEDDFDNSMASNKGFDANELLSLERIKNKRESPAGKQTTQTLNIKDVLSGTAA